MLARATFKASRAFRAFPRLFSSTAASQSPPVSSITQELNKLSAFWLEQSKLVDWFKEPTQGLDYSNPPFFKWFPDGVLNMSYNCLDRHIHQGFGSDPALIYESPSFGISSIHTYGELFDKVSRFANVLQKHGVNKGDRVVIYMPNTPEAVIAAHACARIGAVHAIVSGGFAAPELARRIVGCKPKLIISASCGIGLNGLMDYKPNIEEAVALAGVPDLKRIIFQRDMKKCELKKGLDFEFYDELAKAKSIECVPLSALDHLSIIYTSGTTGAPKGILRSVGSYTVHEAFTIKNSPTLHRRDAMFCATDIGFAGAHLFALYLLLMAGASPVIYEPKSVSIPDPKTIFSICEKHKVTTLYLMTSALRAIRKEDPEGRHITDTDLSKLQLIMTGGERLDTATFDWITSKMPKTCSLGDVFGQTETGALYMKITNRHMFKNKTGTIGKYTTLANIVILDEHGQPVPHGTPGAVCVKYPPPPSAAATIYGNDAGFVEKFHTRFPGYFFNGDLGFFDEEGILQITGRVDDVVMIGSFKASVEKVEEVLTQHPDVAEAAVVGVRDQLIGEKPFAFIVLRAGVTRNHAEIERECMENIKNTFWRVAEFKDCIVVVDELPYNTNAKVLKGVLKKIANGENMEIPASIKNPDSIVAIQSTVAKYRIRNTAEKKFTEAASL